LERADRIFCMNHEFPRDKVMAIAQALAEEREETLERAAKIAEQIEESHAPEVNSFAKAIRSLR